MFLVQEGRQGMLALHPRRKQMMKHQPMLMAFFEQLATYLCFVTNTPYFYN
jgi:hypothetical protein